MESKSYFHRRENRSKTPNGCQISSQFSCSCCISSFLDLVLHCNTSSSLPPPHLFGQCQLRMPSGDLWWDRCVHWAPTATQYPQCKPLPVGLKRSHAFRKVYLSLSTSNFLAAAGRALGADEVPWERQYLQTGHPAGSRECWGLPGTAILLLGSKEDRKLWLWTRNSLSEHKTKT